MKLLTFALLGYFFYRFFIRPALPAQSNKNDSNKGDEQGEYIDYEEVE
jgi:hypothetical protein